MREVIEMKKDVLIPPFPLWKITLNQPLLGGVGIKINTSAIGLFIENRPNDSWLLIGSDTLCCDEQIWTAWLGIQRRKNNDSMRSNSIDGEMLRLLSGTHHVSAGIKRAGISNEDITAWIVHIPQLGGSGEVPELADEKLTELSSIAEKLAQVISAEITAGRPIPQKSGLVRLKIINEDDKKDYSDEEVCDLMIANIAASDLQG